jgi:membrane protein YdbS with pleckstrin-like domain
VSFKEFFNTQTPNRLAKQYHFASLAKNVIAGGMVYGIFIFVSRYIDTDKSALLSLVMSLAWYLVPGIITSWVVCEFMSDLRSRYGLSKGSLHFKNGWLNPNLVTVPVKRVQHVEVKQALIERCFGLHSVKVLSAGHGIVVPGLLHNDALSLRDTLLSSIDDE